MYSFTNFFLLIFLIIKLFRNSEIHSRIIYANKFIGLKNLIFTHWFSKKQTYNMLRVK